jgi:flagellar biosynthesis/type III secretory pathway ATPase
MVPGLNIFIKSPMLNQSPLYRREGNFTGASLAEDFPVTPEDALIIDSLARFHPSMPELPQAANGIPLEAASR